MFLQIGRGSCQPLRGIRRSSGRRHRRGGARRKLRRDGSARACIFRRGSFHSSIIRHIGFQHDGLAATRFNFATGGFETIHPARQQPYRVSLPAERTSSRAPDTRLLCFGPKPCDKAGERVGERIGARRRRNGQGNDQDERK